jgi:hypothetical protein
MDLVLAAMLLMLAVPGTAAAQTADCHSEPPAGPALSLSLDIAGRPGVPAGTTGQAYVAVPMTPPGVACQEAPRPPIDILRGEPGGVLGPASRDLLRGPGMPHVSVETR